MLPLVEDSTVLLTLRPPQLTRSTLSSARQTSPVLYAPLNVDCRLSRSFSDKARDERYDCDLLSERPVS
ncbi:hypothetical protein PGT21_015385 [Puccinia graminis f. sp. tritici]|uniref:Uncharacterized protein n=1 Tax=Puccinia graminis f. sp. tritici TaxID=56615 RepID=A0A5B0M9S4_PUCGR|nr:hypothetical protein PGT21_015385 [Puccinia graminis f. sp. tritici]